MKYKGSALVFLVLTILLGIALYPMYKSVAGFGTVTNVDMSYVFWQMRVPTMLMAIIAGGTLALTGLNYQYLFQNHLASPYTLGMASAAAFGASFFVYVKKHYPFLPDSIQSLFGIGFALLTVFLLIRFIGENKDSLYKVLLCGIAASLIFSSLIILIQYVIGNRDGFELMVSLLGNLTVIGYQIVSITLALLLVLIGVTFRNYSKLRLLSVNYDFMFAQVARPKGVFLETVLIPSIVTAYLVTEVGPISFIGLIVPHVTRLFFRPKGREEIIINLLLGGALLLACELLSKHMLPSLQLPVGVMTSILGGLFLITILFR